MTSVSPTPTACAMPRPMFVAALHASLLNVSSAMTSTHSASLAGPPVTVFNHRADLTLLRKSRPPLRCVGTVCSPPPARPPRFCQQPAPPSRIAGCCWPALPYQHPAHNTSPSVRTLSQHDLLNTSMVTQHDHAGTTSFLFNHPFMHYLSSALLRC